MEDICLIFSQVCHAVWAGAHPGVTTIAECKLHLNDPPDRLDCSHFQRTPPTASGSFMSASTLLFSLQDGVAVVTINRPDKLNALNDAVFRELAEIVSRAESDPAIRGVIVTGAGPKAFAAGADIAELASQGPSEAKARSLAGQAVMRRLEALGKPVIAAVNGFCLGGGC